VGAIYRRVRTIRFMGFEPAVVSVRLATRPDVLGARINRCRWLPTRFNPAQRLRCCELQGSNAPNGKGPTHERMVCDLSVSMFINGWSLPACATRMACRSTRLERGCPLLLCPSRPDSFPQAQGTFDFPMRHPFVMEYSTYKLFGPKTWKSSSSPLLAPRNSTRVPSSRSTRTSNSEIAQTLTT